MKAHANEPIVHLANQHSWQSQYHFLSVRQRLDVCESRNVSSWQPQITRQSIRGQTHNSLSPMSVTRSRLQ